MDISFHFHPLLHKVSLSSSPYYPSSLLFYEDIGSPLGYKWVVYCRLELFTIGEEQGLSASWHIQQGTLTGALTHVQKGRDINLESVDLNYCQSHFLRNMIALWYLLSSIHLVTGFISIGVVLMILGWKVLFIIYSITAARSPGPGPIAHCNGHVTDTILKNVR